MRPIRIALLATILISATARGQEPSDIGNRISPGENHPASQRYETAMLMTDSLADYVRSIEGLETRLALTEDFVRLLAEQKAERCRQLLDSVYNDLLESMKAGEAAAPVRSGQPEGADATPRRMVSIAAVLDGKLAQSYVERYLARESAFKNQPSTPNPLGTLKADCMRVIVTTSASVKAGSELGDERQAARFVRALR